MTLYVVIFDMLELRRVFERRYVPVQLPQPLMQRRVARSYITDVALEMLHIDRVEANDGSIEANIGFRDIGTEIVGSSVFSKMSFGAVERGKKGLDGFFISFLRSRNGKLVAEGFATRAWETRAGETSVRSKARFVDSIVDIVVCPIICPFNFCSQFLREQINALVLVRDYIVKFCVEHSDDFAGLITDIMSPYICHSEDLGTHLIADYLVLLDIIKSWHGKATRVLGINVEVDFSKMGEVLVYWVQCDVFSRYILFCRCEAPSF